MAQKTTTKPTLRKTTGPRALQSVQELSTVLLTPAQFRCLQAWYRLYEKLGREPSVRAVSKEMGLADNGAAQLIRDLDRKGAFSRELVKKPGPREITDVGLKWLSMGT